MDLGAALRQSSASERGAHRLSGSERSSLLRKANSFIYSKVWSERKKKKKKEAESKEEGSSVDEQIVLKMDLSRRKRNSFLRKGMHKQASVRDMNATNVTAYLSARVEAERPVVADVYDHSLAIAKALSKAHMLDIHLNGDDDVLVGASSFILACYSPVLEEVFFKKKKIAMYDENKQKLAVDFCNSSVLKAAVHHCFTGELSEDFNVSENSEGIARKLAQLGRFATTFQMRALGEVAYRAARKLINRRAVLACAVFDELSALQGVAGFDNIKGYALDTIRDMPMDTLLRGGVQWMNETSIECIMQDQDMDVDEFYMFKILNAWEQGANRVESRLPKAKMMAKNIELKFIAVELIKSQIKRSGYFEVEHINASIRAIEETLAGRDPHEMERVIVEGAGLDHVNGIYLRVLGEHGMTEEDILFVKEADDGISDVGLYLYRDKWNIAMCTDYSNCFYSCPDDPVTHAFELVPRMGWSASRDENDPAPVCTYIPNTRKLRSSVATSFLAPNLEEMIDPTIAEKRRSEVFDRSLDDTVEKRTMTLEQMMNLPEDRTDPSLNASDRSFKFDD
jgi:ribosomal protein S12